MRAAPQEGAERGGALGGRAAEMSGAGAALRGYGAELRDGLAELRARRDELSGRIREREAERSRLQRRIWALTERLAGTSESLARDLAARAELDRTIAETEVACGQILESSQALLDTLEEGPGNAGKGSEQQSTSKEKQAHEQKRS
ncbi:LOW QUALITY PROTEIN: microtubule nucleation factor SSNA1-like [Pezoporus occidentalis]|uniref:LOW QUALITY PROTEIN: microtubule nucleation factor SSNA1-like n=1 Tax=Pezoporus flaviventris TaxID=889875 RepID=UPI002AB1694B|nr:LOW QUALITY PROTEIN: microtubule nucleation factor SSNA1-like [Pezoporus flaviventris]